MGIEFTGLDEATQERLQQQIDAMAAESGTSEERPGRWLDHPILFPSNHAAQKLNPGCAPAIECEEP